MRCWLSSSCDGVFAVSGGDGLEGEAPCLFVTNMHRNFTGVSATAAAVASQQARDLPMRLVGEPLPGCPSPITPAQARHLSRRPPRGKPFSIWHVRRNNEMRAAIFARDVMRLPIRIVFTSAAQRHHSLVPRWLISRMDRVIATTPEAATFVKSDVVIPHGVDTARFHPAADRAAAWAATGYPGTAGIATVGRIRPEKGTDRFVEAMIEALPQLPGVTALVIGKAGSEHKAFLDGLKGRAAAAGLSERLLFPGEVVAECMPGLLQSLSLLVALPRYEGYGVTPLEAMASGVPFVASDAGHFRAFAGQGVAGVVLPQDGGLVMEAARQAVRLVSDTGKVEGMGRGACLRAHDHFGVSAEVAGIRQVYEDLWNISQSPETARRAR
ncbi:MAG: glycosyltransferase family 4 protein [Notoacmeibacter sp.]|nr:glycosyltransferase family 4 protein [Notoacmeibacter sp.]